MKVIGRKTIFKSMEFELAALSAFGSFPMVPILVRSEPEAPHLHIADYFIQLHLAWLVGYAVVVSITHAGGDIPTVRLALLVSLLTMESWREGGYAL